MNVTVDVSTYATSSNRASRSSPPDRAGLRDALAAEIVKLFTVRSTVWTIVVMAAMTLGIALFVGLTESLQPDDTVLGGSLTGASTAQIAAGIFGVLAVSGEYGSGTMRATLTASPRRASVLGAKAILVAGVVFVVALFSCSISYGVGIITLPDGVYAQGDPMPALLGVALAFSATAVLGLAIGTALRNSGGAITAVTGLLLMPTLFGPLFGDLQRWVAGAGPTAVVQKLAQSSDAVPEAVGSLGAWPSLLLSCAMSGAAWLVAARVLERRDA